MRLAVIGNGVVGRALARSMAAHTPGTEITVFYASEGIAASERQPSDADAMIGYDLTFRQFDCDGGSMAIWGGVLAVPTEAWLRRVNISMPPEALMQQLSLSLHLDLLYGRDFGPLAYLLKGATDVALPETVQQVGQRIERLVPNDSAVDLVGSDGSALGRFDACFIATGASCIPVTTELGDVVLRRPDVIFDKLVTIEPRNGDFEATFLDESGVTSLSVPISLPIQTTSAHISAVFHHILTRSDLMSSGAVISGYLRHAASFLAIAVAKLSGRNNKLWFKTYCGSDRHPLTLKEGVLSHDVELIKRFGGKVYMPALHSDARLDPQSALPNGIFTEHLTSDLPPIPFNPVAVRFAKLFAQFHTFSHQVHRPS